MSERLRVTMRHEGPTTVHNLQCWLCEERPAVYESWPSWRFSPCWTCQRLLKADRSLWERFLRWLA